MLDNVLNGLLNGIFDVKINNTSKVLAHNQSVDDIASAILVAEFNSREQGKKLASHFRGQNKLDVLKNFHAWQRKNLLYKAEPGNRQSAKEVNRILKDSKHGNDCKHYATVSMSLMRALNIPGFFRMVSQNKYDKNPTHIYTVAVIDGQRYILDPCMSRFNSEDPYHYKYDIKPVKPLL